MPKVLLFALGVLCACMGCAKSADTISTGRRAGDADGDMQGADGGNGGPQKIGNGRDGCSAPIDVVFAIDVSTSMSNEIKAVRNGMDSIWAAAESLNEDTRFGLVVFVDSVQVVNDCSAFADAASLQGEFNTWEEFTKTNKQPGASGANRDCLENSIDAIYAAANDCTWRDDASKFIIHATDDSFAEKPASLSGIAVQHDYAETLALVKQKQIRVGSFSAATKGDYCLVGTSPNPGQGFHGGYMNMDAITDASGGRAWDINGVREQTIDMADAINELVEDSYCVPLL